MVDIQGKGGISAKIIADSICPRGKRVTTFELNYPRFIHSEFLTHRLFSRNAASSRAIPVPKMIDNIKANTAMPIHWGAHQRGMQADDECDAFVSSILGYEGDEYDKPSREQAWDLARNDAIFHAKAFHQAGYHKQIVNRLLEPFQFIKVVCTATEYDNFFWLRSHKDAQPEIRELSNCMYKAYQESEPTFLRIGEWHVPYVDTFRASDGDASLEYIVGNIGVSLEAALKVSSSCCAQVSYRLTDNSLEKAEMLYSLLVDAKPVHASPFEHQCTPMDCEVDLDTEGVTGYTNGLGYNSGNFFGFIQHRQLIDNHSCWNYEPE
jgi:hypothetical protein